MVQAWRDELVARGDLVIAPLGLDIYSGRPVYVATLQNKARFQRFQERPAIPDAVRQFVYDRDGRRCLHCGTARALSLDHIHPYSLGGSDEPDNLQTLCRPCNSRKGAKV
jgi:5-methylcytosine-specific restriction endonuclease McrA